MALSGCGANIMTPPLDLAAIEARMPVSRAIADKRRALGYQADWIDNLLNDTSALIARVRELESERDALKAQIAEAPRAPESVYKSVERILDEKSAWISRPNAEVTEAIALAVTIAAVECLRTLPDKDALEAVVREAVTVERDACAEIAEQYPDEQMQCCGIWIDDGSKIAAAIRARGEKETE